MTDTLSTINGDLGEIVIRLLRYATARGGRAAPETGAVSDAVGRLIDARCLLERAEHAARHPATTLTRQDLEEMLRTAPTVDQIVSEIAAKFKIEVAAIMKGGSPQTAKSAEPTPPTTQV